MPNIFKILFIVLLAVVSFRLSASTGGKKTANDGSGSNSSSAGIGTNIKRIVTAGLLFTSLATGGAQQLDKAMLREQMPPDWCHRMLHHLILRNLKRQLRLKKLVNL
ncbi:hypothetical protein niasHS_016226 [Heterodera schachtii]|uniref:Uncharacterized protein n=1 Tax=Heterodera schachtii TaxID=97005 RepID=A0ABD2HWS6_HETSC